MPSTIASGLVLTAILAVLRADSTLTGLVADAPTAYGGKGIYPSAPQGAARPFLVVFPEGERPFDTMGSPAALKWGGMVGIGFKAVCEFTPTAGLSVLSRTKTVLDGQALSVSGFGSVVCAWEQMHPPYSELIGGQVVWHLPASMTVTLHEGSV